jgi:hypothetical protein
VVIQQGTRGAARDGGAIVLVILCIVANVLLAGMVVLNGLAGVMFVMGSDSCSSPSTKLICTGRGQGLAITLPIAAAVVGLLVATIGAWAWPRRLRPLWIAAGWLIAVCGLVTDGAIATGH